MKSCKDRTKCTAHIYFVIPCIKTKVEPFHWDLGRCGEGGSSACVYVADAWCDVWMKEVKVRAGVAFVTKEVARRKKGTE